MFKKKKNELIIINFIDLISNPKNFISTINRLCYHNKYKVSPSQIEGAVNTYRGATDTYGSSKPNPEKEKLKNVLKEELINISEYKRAEKIYKTLS